MMSLNRFQRYCCCLTGLTLVFFCLRPPWRVAYRIEGYSKTQSDQVVVWAPVWSSVRDVNNPVAEEMKRAFRAKYDPHWRAGDQAKIAVPPGVRKMSDFASIDYERLTLVCLAVAFFGASACVVGGTRRAR